MRVLSRFVNGVAALFGRRRQEAELDAELQAFLQASTDEKIAAGMTAQEARRAARAGLGSEAAVKDWVRDAGWEFHLETAWKDAGYALRILRRSPAFAAAAILTFALGIGANTAIFSIVDAAVLRPLPYDEPDRLVTVSFENPATGRKTTGMSPRGFLDWRERQQVFEQLAAGGGGRATLLGAGEPEEVSPSKVTAGFFEVFRARPLIGRTFTASDEVTGQDRVVILSHGFWQTRFAADAGVLGRTLTLNGVAHEIVGVLPPDFSYPAGSPRPALIFIPLAFAAEDRQHGVAQSLFLSVEARLRSGVTIAQAEAALGDLQTALAGSYVGLARGYTRVRLTPMIEGYIGTARPWMLMLLGAVTLVLLIACANVANLVLAHATTRTRELTVRAALGASRARIGRQLLTESLLLAFIGAAVGVLCAWWGINVLRGAMPATIPRAASVGLDLRVLGFTLAVTLATGLICGLLPAFRGSRVDLAGGLKDGGGHGATAGRSQQRVRQILVWAEISLAVVLAVGATLFISSFARLLRVDQGFDPSGTISFTVSVPRPPAGQPLDQTVMPAMLESVRAVPGVTAALIADGGGPYAGGYATFPVRITGRPAPAPIPGGEPPSIRFRKISTGFLELLHVPLVRGRGFTSGDARGSLPVAIVNEAAVRQFWGGEDPIGDRLEIQKVQYEVVGVAGDMRYSGPATAVVPEVFLPYAQSAFRSGTFIVHSAGTGASILPALKAAIWRVNPGLPITEVRTAEELFDRVTSARRFNMLLMSVFAVLALVIATTGIYGVLAFVVAQRAREVGVRIALGASRTGVIGLFVKQAALLIAAGVVTGLAGAWMLAKTVESFLFQITPRDPGVLAFVALAMIAVGLLAAWIPARRAARVDPLSALRNP